MTTRSTISWSQQQVSTGSTRASLCQTSTTRWKRHGERWTGRNDQLSSPLITFQSCSKIRLRGYTYKINFLSFRYMRCKNRDDTTVVGLPQTNPLGFRENGISFCKPLYYDGQVLSDQTLCRRSNESKLKKKSDDHVLTNRHLRHFQCGPWRVRCVQCGHENGSCLEGSYGWLFGMRVGIRVKHVIKLICLYAASMISLSSLQELLSGTLATLAFGAEESQEVRTRIVF